MSKRSLKLLVDDIWESIEKIERYITGMSPENFQNDEKTTDAVVRNLEIIGEAAGRLPKDFTNQRSEIEWIKIIGLRNRIVHEYLKDNKYMVHPHCVSLNFGLSMIIRSQKVPPHPLWKKRLPI